MFLEQEHILSRVLRAVQAIRDRKMIIMVDEEDRENEGDIVFAAEHSTPELVNFMCKEARGLICLALEPRLIDRLELPMMRDFNKSQSQRETAFTVSIEAREGVTTGISAHDRSHTIQVAIADASTPNDIVVPGHIFPLRAKPGGTLERAGHTEGSIDLVRFAGCKGAAVICEIMNEDGTMARMGDLRKMAEKFDLPIVSIPEIIQYRLLQESFVECEAEQSMHLGDTKLRCLLFKSKIDQSRHVAIIKGQIDESTVVDVRVHTQKPLIDTFSALNMISSSSLQGGIRVLEQSKTAVFLYLQRDREPESIVEEFKGLGGWKAPQVAMDRRQIGLGAQILRQLGVKKMRIHSSGHHSYIGLSGFGLEVVEHLALGENTK